MLQHDDREPYEFILITPQSYCVAVSAAQRGYEDARVTLYLVHQTYSALKKESAECLCSDCKTLLDTKLNQPSAFAICIPMFLASKSGFFDTLASGLCDRCSQRSDLFECVAELMHEALPKVTLVDSNMTKQ